MSSSRGSGSTRGGFRTPASAGRPWIFGSKSTTPGIFGSRNTTPGNVGSKSTTPRSLTRGSSTGDPHYFLAIAVGRGQASCEVGIACAGINSPNLVLSQFTDNQNHTKTLAKIHLFQPRKVLMTSGMCSNGQKSRLCTEIEKEHLRLEIVPIQRRHYNDSKGLRRIKMLANEEFSTLPPMIGTKYYALAAAAALLTYVELVVGIIYSPRTMRVEFQASENTALIDSATAKHLELIASNVNPNSTHSLVGILSKCSTPSGARCLRGNILQPPCNMNLIARRLDCVEEFVRKPELLYGVQASLSRLPIDVEHMISNLIRIPSNEKAKVVEQRASLVVALKHTLQVIPGLDVALDEAEHPYFIHLKNEIRVPAMADLVNKIESVINEEAHYERKIEGMRMQRTFLIKPGVSNFLDLARKIFCDIVDEVTMYGAELGNEHNLPLQVIHSTTRGFFLQYRVHDNEVVAPANLPSSFLQVQRKRNMVSFTTREMLSFDHRERDILSEIDALSDMIIAQLVTDIREKVGSLYRISDAVANLDLLHSFALYAVGNQVVRPQFSSSLMSITKGRHPLLDNVNLEPTIPNDAFLSTDVNVNVITGPNMSGKTTYLKQVATLQVMAQIGCFVPAKAATFRVANGIFSRLGSEDNIEGNSSTFAVEMEEISFILKNSGGTPLVIIDELGRATSVEEGTAISWAVLENLLKTKAFVLCATHFLYLTKLETLHLNVLNFKMDTREVFSAARRVFGIGEEFRIEYSHVSTRGVTDVEYYGLQLAKNSSLPKKVIERAHEIAQCIMASRENRQGNAGTEEYKRKQIYLLGSHVAFAAEALKNQSTSVKVAYLRGLQKQFEHLRV